MTLTPTVLPTDFSELLVRRTGTNNNQKTHSTSSVTEISDNIKTIKDNSLLYQLISRLLLLPEQDKQLKDSLKLANINEASETLTSSTSFQFALSIEVISINITQQSLTFTDENGSFTETRTIIQATSISIEVTLSGQFRSIQVADPLVIDLNGDGITTSGIELFRDQTGYDNGFSYLKSFDDNEHGLIDAKDHIFNSLLVMRLIANKQFISEISKTDISSINLDYINTDRTTAKGDRIVQISDYKNSDGQKV